MVLSDSTVIKATQEIDHFQLTDKALLIEDESTHYVSSTNSHLHSTSFPVIMTTESLQPDDGVVKKWARRCCTKKTLKKYFPILTWLPSYNMQKFQSDAIAGITVGLTVIPQGMAYASVAGLPLEYGLYSAFMACFVYCVFGGTKEVTIGPTAIMGLLTADLTRIGGAPYAVTLCFLTGVVELLFGVLNLGFFIDFIATPVISGFTSAAAIIIGTTQIKGLLGLKFKADHFVDVIYNVGVHIQETNFWDLSLGVVCMVLLLILRKFNSIPWKSEPVTIPQKVLRKLIWFLSIGRNAIVVILAGLLAFVLVIANASVFSLTDEVKGGIPDFKIPQFTLERDNRTVDFLEIISDMGPSLGLIPLLAILEHIAIAKIFADGKTINASQEIIALGLSNVLGSFVSSFPGTGSFSRTALNNSSGVKTAFGGVFTGCLVLLALGVLTTSFKFIPKATLSAVIITTVFFMIEYEMVPHLWKTKKTDFVILAVTFFSCLFAGAEYGILIGIGVSLIILLYSTARPTISVEKTALPNVEYIIVQPDRTLYFPAAEYMKYRVNKMASVNSDIPVVFDGCHLAGPDFTIAQGLKQLTVEFKNRNQKLVFTNLRPEVVKLMQTMKPEEFQHCRSKDEIESLLKTKYPGATMVNGSVQSLDNAKENESKVDQQQSLAQIAEMLFPIDYQPPEMVNKEIQVDINELSSNRS